MRILRVLCLAFAAAGLAVAGTTATGITFSDEANAQGGRPGNYKTKQNQQSKNRPSNYQGNWNQTLTRKGGGQGQTAYSNQGSSKGSSKGSSQGASKGSRPPPTAYMRSQRASDRPGTFDWMPPGMTRNLCEGIQCFFINRNRDFPGPLPPRG